MTDDKDHLTFLKLGVRPGDWKHNFLRFTFTERAKDHILTKIGYTGQDTLRSLSQEQPTVHQQNSQQDDPEQEYLFNTDAEYLPEHGTVLYTLTLPDKSITVDRIKVHPVSYTLTE